MFAELMDQRFYKFSNIIILTHFLNFLNDDNYLFSVIFNLDSS